MLWTLVVSSASSKVSGGRIVERRFAIIDFPVPGGPISSTLWPPAAAISSARFTDSWPLTSAKSSSLSRPCSKIPVRSTFSGAIFSVPSRKFAA